MKTKYRLTRNGTYAGDYDTELQAQCRAQELEGFLEMTWREGEEGMVYAVGSGSPMKRNEYEIVPTRVSTALYR